MAKAIEEYKKTRADSNNTGGSRSANTGGTVAPDVHRCPCPPRCGKCHKLGHQEGDCRTRIPIARDNSLQNVTCFGCGNHGHYRSDCPELKNRN
ncbi:reverse transcriptase domain-containing protein [Tanacetum coccineum]